MDDLGIAIRTWVSKAWHEPRSTNQPPRSISRPGIESTFFLLPNFECCPWATESSAVPFGRRVSECIRTFFKGHSNAPKPCKMSQKRRFRPPGSQSNFRSPPGPPAWNLVFFPNLAGSRGMPSHGADVYLSACIGRYRELFVFPENRLSTAPLARMSVAARPDDTRSAATQSPLYRPYHRSDHVPHSRHFGSGRPMTLSPHSEQWPSLGRRRRRMVIVRTRMSCLSPPAARSHVLHALRRSWFLRGAGTMGDAADVLTG